MANPEHLKILMQGAEQWNKWTKENHDVEPDLREAKLWSADLSDADLKGVDLTGADLRRADLSGVNLAGANLSLARLDRATIMMAYMGYANLTGAKLAGASLIVTDFREANLANANLNDALLSGSNLHAANLTETDFSNVRATLNDFGDVDLSTAKGLDTIYHGGPSTIGIDTIYKSRGKIPDKFLRGCGVPDEFITFVRNMAVSPIDLYSCFISYSTHDQEFAERLYADLQAKGVRCWFAPEEMKGGRKLHEQIDEAIRLHDKLLLILSEHSMNSSWVKTEIANAREREKREGKQLLFPITLVPFEAIKQWKLFDADIGIDSACEIREYFIPDFSNWKDHDSYQAAFQRLVKDLKAGAGG